MARGRLTDEVKQLSMELLGYEITVRGLRLLPYLMSCLTDNSNLEIARISTEERAILLQWKKEGRLTDPASDLTVTADFYDIICKLLKIGYCLDMIKGC